MLMTIKSSALIILALAAFGEPEKLPTIPDSELAIAGVSIDADEAMVLKTLGRPVKITDNGEYLSVQWDYPGLTIWFDEDHRVGEIISISPKHCTASGICPGATLSQVQSMYGSPLTATREEGEFMEYLPESNFPCWLQLAVVGDVIHSVRLVCQP